MNVGSDDDENENFTLEDFTKIDADVVATETRCADDIISGISNIHEDDSSDDDDDVLPIPISAETTSAFDYLFCAFECNSDIPHGYKK